MQLKKCETYREIIVKINIAREMREDRETLKQEQHALQKEHSRNKRIALDS